MSDSSLSIAMSLATAQAAATRQTIQTEMLRQQAAADKSVVALLQQSSDQQKATLPAGQGVLVDISA